MTYCQNSNKPLTESSVDFYPAVTHPDSIGRCLEKSGVLEMAATRCGAKRGDGTVWLIIRLSSSPEHLQFTSQSSTLPSGKVVPSSAVSPLCSSPYRRAVGIFHFHLASAPSCRALFLIESPRGSRWLP